MFNVLIKSLFSLAAASQVLLILFSAVIFSTKALAASEVDYSKEDSWLCLPGREDACQVDLAATVVQEDGSTTREHFAGAKNPAFDCFYVYPTVSLDKTENSDMVANEEERRVIESQLARFQSACKLYAPVYRQITLSALRARLEKGAAAGDGALAYGDVESAFDYYLEHFNQGRPFVLIGHSQGSRMLTTLLQKRFDHTELKDQLISALIIGAPVQVKTGSDRGGSFDNIPLCSSADQVGCVVAYASFRSDAPPPEKSLFGKRAGKDLQAACVNPAAPGSDQTVPLDAYLGTQGAGNSSLSAQPWASGLKKPDTDFVKVPGLLSAACKNDADGSYLAVIVNAKPDDPRVDDIVGDVVIGEQRRPEWGLHLVDISVAQGDLISLIQRQAAAWSQQ